ncbi:MAG TPA: ABC transporter permease, partial [Chthoniobacterales bacterium]|nr:ABC transporter permease [Chthoniobacterales bacterium]
MNDLRFALRQLRKSPGFTFVAVLTLALGIGANTAIFSVVNAVLLKPLPFPAPQQLVALGMTNSHDGTSRDQLGSLSYPDYFDFRKENRTLSSVSIYADETAAFNDAGDAQSLGAVKCSGDFFQTLGIKPIIGRDFVRADEQAGGGPGGYKVILSYDFWKKHFG